MALGLAVSLVVALAWAIWWLVASARRDRRGAARPAHRFRGQGEAVTVAELLRDAQERGEGFRLNWTEDDLNTIGLIRPYARDQLPTTILPKIDNNGGVDEG